MSIRSMPSNKAYRGNYDAIFNKGAAQPTTEKSRPLGSDGLVLHEVQPVVLEPGTGESAGKGVCADQPHQLRHTATDRWQCDRCYRIFDGYDGED